MINFRGQGKKITKFRCFFGVWENLVEFCFRFKIDKKNREENTPQQQIGNSEFVDPRFVKTTNSKYKFVMIFLPIKKSFTSFVLFTCYFFR